MPRYYSERVFHNITDHKGDVGQCTDLWRIFDSHSPRGVKSNEDPVASCNDGVIADRIVQLLNEQEERKTHGKS